jgi:ribosome assembly protein RRB1
MSSDRKRRADEPASLDESVTSGLKDLVFADPFEDVIEDSGSEGDDADVDDGEVVLGGDESQEAARASAGAASSAGGAADSRKPADSLVWRPGVDVLGEGETLDYDPSAYIMLHQLAVEWPCLSFDILPDR